jgi:hypothetical protein
LLVGTQGINSIRTQRNLRDDHDLEIVFEVIFVTKGIAFERSPYDANKNLLLFLCHPDSVLKVNACIRVEVGCGHSVGVYMTPNKTRLLEHRI